VQNIRITEEYLQGLSINELEKLVSQLEDRLLSMNIQLSDAKAKLENTGERADPDWFGRITKAKRICGRHHQRATKELSRKKKEDAKRSHEENAFNKFFVRRAKEHLSDTVYTAIASQAYSDADTTLKKERGILVPKTLSLPGTEKPID